MALFGVLDATHQHLVIGTDLVGKAQGEGFRGLDERYGRLTFRLVLAVVEAFVTITASAQQPLAEEHAILPQALAPLATTQARPQAAAATNYRVLYHVPRLS